MNIRHQLFSIALVAGLVGTIGCGDSPTGPTSDPAPQLATLSVTSGQQGSSVNVVMGGSNLAGSTLAFSPATGLTTTNLQTTASSLTATIAVATGAPLGDRQVTARVGSVVSNAMTFTITTCTLPAPTGVRRTALFSGGKIYLVHLWDRLTGATSYVVEAGPTSGATTRSFDTATTSDPTNPAVFLEVTTGTWFSRVRARNACGLGAPSVELQSNIS